MPNLLLKFQDCICNYCSGNVYGSRAVKLTSKTKGPTHSLTSCRRVTVHAMALSTGGTVVLVLLVVLILIVSAVLVFIKCRNQSPKRRPWKPARDTAGEFRKLETAPAEPRPRSLSNRSPLFDPRQTPTHLVIPFASSTPNVTTIHIPVGGGTRRLSGTDSDTDSFVSGSAGDEDRAPSDGAPAAGVVRTAASGEALARSCPGETSSESPAERDADGEDSAASWTLSPAHSGPDVGREPVMSAPEMSPASRNKTTLESDYEETAYSVYRQEKEVLQTQSTAMPHELEHTTVVDNHLFQAPDEKKKKKRRRRGLSVPHMPYRHHTKGERRDSAQLLHEQFGVHKGRAGSEGSIAKLAEPMGKLFIRIQHRANEEKLMLLVNKVQDLDLPERLSYKTFLNPVLYIRGGFLPSMSQRFITKFAALSEGATWGDQFAILGVSTSAAWQLRLRLHLCFRESSVNRPQILGVSDIVLGQMNLESSQEFILNFFTSERYYSDLGDVHLSVCYQPALRRMVFLVLEARDLPRSALFGSIHSVAKIEMICARKRVEKQKSKVVREPHCPVWNDQVVFTIPPTNMRLQDIHFDVTVMHVDMVKGAHNIGKCELGWTATCEELQHWNDVMQNPNRPIPMWLSLQCPD